MPLTPVAESYVGMTGGVVSIGGTTPAVIDGKYTMDVAVDEMTNNQSGGWHEDIVTIFKASGDMTVAYKTGSSYPVQGSIYALAIAIPGGPGITGNVRVTKRDFPGVDPKKGVKVGLSWTSFGVMTSS